MTEQEPLSAKEKVDIVCMECGAVFQIENDKSGVKESRDCFFEQFCDDDCLLKYSEENPFNVEFS